MKKGILFILYTCFVMDAAAQAPPVDSLLKVLSTTQNDSVKVEVLCSLSFYEPEFKKGMDYAQRALEIAEKMRYEKGVGDCYFQMANMYSVVSNHPMALHYYLESLKIWERTNHRPGMGADYVAIGVIYKEQGDYKNALDFFRKAEAAKPVNLKPEALAYGSALLYSHFGDLYLQQHQSDSALKYFQRSYENFTASKEEYQLNQALNGLAQVQFSLGNPDIALGYYRQAIINGRDYNDTLGLSATYLGMAQLYDAGGRPDSAIYYGEMAMMHAQRSNVLKDIIEAGKLLSRLYQHKDDAEALRYLQVSQIANDSMYGRQKTMQLQNMFFNELEREKELAKKEKEETETRRLNIEYAFIAIGIVTFIILFLLLSRSIIVTERWISFFGILGLLVVFEFINLLIHPSIASFTHDSPLLMLVALVAVASLLIPLHHRLEKWIREKVTEKNKKIRLENARKTIEILEKETAFAEEVGSRQGEKTGKKPEAGSRRKQKIGKEESRQRKPER